MERDPIRWDSLLSILSPRSPLRSPLRFSPWFSIYLETPSQGRPPARGNRPERVGNSTETQDPSGDVLSMETGNGWERYYQRGGGRRPEGMDSGTG